MDIKTFIKILKITALVVSVACVLFVLYIFVILNLLFHPIRPRVAILVCPLALAIISMKNLKKSYKICPQSPLCQA